MKDFRKMGGMQVFLKTFRASLFNEDLSNEPNFGWIHLAGQSLYTFEDKPPNPPNPPALVPAAFCSYLAKTTLQRPPGFFKYVIIIFIGNFTIIKSCDPTKR